jgi:predicted transposase YdaD
MDYISGINNARCEGIAIGEQRGMAIGEQRGRQEASLEIIKLLKEGKSVEEISRLFSDVK